MWVRLPYDTLRFSGISGRILLIRLINFGVFGDEHIPRTINILRVFFQTRLNIGIRQFIPGVFSQYVQLSPAYSETNKFRVPLNALRKF